VSGASPERQRSDNDGKLGCYPAVITRRLTNPFLVNSAYALKLRRCRYERSPCDNSALT
jgi:hypothetical protein